LFVVAICLLLSMFEFFLRRRVRKEILRELSLGVHIDGRTVDEIQSELAGYSHRVTDPAKLKIRLHKRREVIPRLLLHYRNVTFSMLKWMAYNGRKRCEDRFMGEFNRRFGEPGKVLVCIGDFSVKGAVSARYHAPTPLRSIVKRFQAAGHHVRLLNECYTSKSCAKCCHNVIKRDGKTLCEDARLAKCMPFLLAPSARPWMARADKRHGLTKCDKCHTVWGRDYNACLNMLYIAIAMARWGLRPLHLPGRRCVFRDQPLPAGR
jgi:hypothetical protein